MPSPTRVVLLRDGSWPLVAGVCCWRSGVRAAFGDAGAQVTEVTCELPNPSVAGGGRGRLPWLPSMVWRPLSTTKGWSVRAVRWPARTVSDRRRRSRLAHQLAGAALVIAESPAAALAAATCGLPRRRLWVLALPVERLFLGESTGYACELAAVAPVVDGFLTDRETARDSVERATSSHRTTVELFPPLAADRACDDCAGAGDEPPAALARLCAGREVSAVPRQLSAQSTWDGPVPPIPPGPPQRGSAAHQLRTARTLLAGLSAPAPQRPPRSALVSGYDLKFAVELAERLDRRGDLAVTVDDWPELGRPTPHTRARLREADAILAEWARTSAIWLSQHKRPGQFLIVRLHRFELDYPYPRDIVIDNVDAVVYIAPLFGRRIRDELGWPVEKLVYLPNFLDLQRLDRPKLPDAQFTLGFVGLEWSRKRFDLALDLLTEVRRQDPRFRLLVRSVMPWQNQYVWALPDQRQYASWCFDRIEREPLLRDAVRFEAPGLDMARWYRQIGHLVSTSDEEGSHASVAEAMGSGAVPVVRPWPGALEVYDKEWVHSSMEAAAAAVRENADPRRFAEQAARAKAEIRRTHDPAAVVAAWADLLHGDLAAARSHFTTPLASRYPSDDASMRTPT